jgi:muramoyltetrapeptide carboxypeptidase
MKTLQKNIRIIYPSSLPRYSEGSFHKSPMENSDFKIIREYPGQTKDWPHNYGETFERYNGLLNSLKDPECVAILCGRGGYGSSELLAQIPWQQIKSYGPKWLVGFSDPCALLFAFFTKLNWPCVHGPMPDSPWWNKNSTADSKQLFNFLDKQQANGSLVLDNLKTSKNSQEGWLFGGCLSILCSLLGTEYLPKSFSRSLLFIEDIGESPARILRYWTQLQQALDFSTISSVILGDFSGLDDKTTLRLKTQMAQQIDIPCFSCSTIGHTSPNYPLVLGADAKITENQLHWSYRR